MAALFADLSERSRQRAKNRRAHRADERHRVFALCDAIQIAIAKEQHDRVSVLLEQMRVIVESALARRTGLVPARGEQRDPRRACGRPSAASSRSEAGPLPSGATTAGNG
jgi:hypothetical protein